MNRLLLVGIAVACFGALAFGAAVPPTQANMKFAWNPAGPVDVGDAAQTVTVILDFTTDGVDAYGVQGWSLGLCYDKTKVNATAATLGADAKISKNGAPPSFEKTNLLADGITCGVVIDFMGVDKVIAPKAAFKALDATFANVALAEGEKTLVKSCRTLGSPPVIPVVVVDGASIPFGTAADLTLENGGITPKTKLELVAAADCVAAAKLTTNENTVDAVSFGVSHTGNFTLKAIDRGTATAAAAFFGAKIVTGGGTVGVVMSLGDPFTPIPASTTAVEVHRPCARKAG